MAAGTVAVVGAGLAGLAATLELKRLGLRVELFERSRLLGGKATSFVVEGIEIDNGQHVFLDCCDEFLDFTDQLGLRDQLYLQPRFAVTLLARGERPLTLRAAALPAPWHLLPVLLRYPGLGWWRKARLVRALLQQRPTSPGASFAAWLERNGQDAVLRRRFWEPFLTPALNASLDDVSAESGLFVIRSAFLADSKSARIGYARIPLGRMAAAAADRADRLHLRTPVTGLTSTAGRATGIRLEDGRMVAADAVILAIPPGSLMRVLGEPDAFGIRGVERIRTRAIIDVHLWYADSSLAFDFAALLDSPVQWVFRKGPGYLVCSLSAADEIAGLTEEALVDLCHRELLAAMPELQAVRLQRGIAVRDKDATFIPSPGLHRPAQATSLPNLVIAGAWTDTGWPATMESAVRSGRAAARLIAAECLPAGEGRPAEVRHAG